MQCLSCDSAGRGLCPVCRLRMVAAPERVVGSLVVRSAAVHCGPARDAIHALKYRGVLSATDPFVSRLAMSLPVGAVFVPLPRVTWRRWKHGIDPALELARAFAEVCDGRVGQLLAPPLVGRARAGQVHDKAPSFHLRRPARGPVVLVDDVITTGVTIAAAAAILPSARLAITATSAPGGRAQND